MKRSHEDRRHDEDLSGDDLDWVIEFVTLRFTSADRGSSPQGGAAKATQQEPSAAPARNSLRMNLPIVSVTLPSADARQRLIELVAARTTTLDEPRNEDLINDKYRTSLFDGADTNDDLLEWVKQSLGAMGLDPEDCDVKYRAGF